MIFNCPNCDKKYQIADTIFGDEGKTVRCVSCAHEWHQEPERIELDFVEKEIEENDHEEELEAVVSQEDTNFFDPEFATSDNDSNEMEDETAAKIKALIEGSSTSSPNENLGSDTIDNLDDENGVPPIPKGVTPHYQENSTKVLDKKEGGKSNKKGKEPKAKVMPKNTMPVSSLAKVNSIIAALLIFLGLFVISIFFRSDIVKAWPASAMIFDKAGFSVALKGEGLVIENFSAKAIKSEDSQGTLLLQGRVVNLTDRTIDVPNMVVYFDDERAPTIDASWIIEPPVQVLTAGESYSFTSKQDNPDKDLKSIVLTFKQEYL